MSSGLSGNVAHMRLIFSDSAQLPDFFLLVLPCGGKKTTKQKTIENQLSATHISCKSRGHWICISDSFNWLITIHANTEFCFAILIRPKRNSLPKAP